MQSSSVRDSMSPADADENSACGAGRRFYLENGFYYHSQSFFAESYLQDAVTRLDGIFNDRYDGDLQPLRKWGQMARGELVKIDQAHHASTVVAELIRNRHVARAAAEVTDSQTLQVWATQLFYKPPGVGDGANVGWHTDKQYWEFWHGEVFTIWIALTESNENTGALRFIKQSHRWSATNRGDALEKDLDKQLRTLVGPARASSTAYFQPLPRGGFSIHHANVFHASGANRSDAPRISLAVHVRNEKAFLNKSKDDFGLCQTLDNLILSPVIHLG